VAFYNHPISRSASSFSSALNFFVYSFRATLPVRANVLCKSLGTEFVKNILPESLNRAVFNGNVGGILLFYKATLHFLDDKPFGLSLTTTDENLGYWFVRHFWLPMFLLGHVTISNLLETLYLYLCPCSHGTDTA
jgi:hypothetical protein